MNKAPNQIFLLRKSCKGDHIPVLKAADFPIRFKHGDKEYRVDQTARGGLIMTTEKDA